MPVGARLHALDAGELAIFCDLTPSTPLDPDLFAEAALAPGERSLVLTFRADMAAPSRDAGPGALDAALPAL